MADIEYSKTADDERYLLISFVEGRPMSALQVSNVLRALDNDYRAMTGRELVLAHLEVGSTWFWLVDAAIEAGGWIKGSASVAKATQELGAFAKKLKDGLKPKAKPSLLPQPDERFDVDKSVTTVAKMAEETNSIIHIQKKIVTANGTETLDITVTPQEAKEARKRIRDKPKPVPAITHEGPRVLAAQKHQLLEKLRSLPPATRELEVMIEALVEAHENLGSVDVLRQVADALEVQGRWDIANIIRQYLPRGRDSVHIETE